MAYDQIAYFTMVFGMMVLWAGLLSEVLAEDADLGGS